MKYVTSERLPIKSWCDAPEGGCLAQARNLANLPFLFKQVCLMPDTHQGYGMPIGGVIAAESVVIPNAVGVDIGCGMHAVKTDVQEISPQQLHEIVGLIRENIPVGFNHSAEPHKLPAFEGCEPSAWEGPWRDGSYPIVSREYEKAMFSLGTLGGGNHFIELQKDEWGFLWFMIHSGSRNLGKQVADHYNKLAVNLNALWHSSVPKEWELAFLPVDTAEGQAYLREMNYCLQFAAANRERMARQIKDILAAVLNLPTFTEEIDIHHNYASMEHHFGHNVMIHRKGATRARAGEVGIIPGSQGTHSYIVEGLGNPDSFMSCSHGAGRRMGRKEAVRSLDFAAEVAALDARGIIHSVRSKDDLDEAPGSYKNIETVMEEQADLVKILHMLQPLAVVKG